MKTTRAYTQTARAEAAAATRRRILDACVALGQERGSLDFPLADIGDRAGVSVQTVLRHFGSRDNLIDATAAYVVNAVQEEREAPVGDLPAALSVLLDHYDSRGDGVIRFLGQESQDPRVARLTANGKQLHREWVQRVFGPDLDALAPTTREELTDLLVVATDVYTWKLLARDRGLPRHRVAAALHRLIRAVLSSAAPPDDPDPPPHVPQDQSRKAVSHERFPGSHL